MGCNNGLSVVGCSVAGGFERAGEELKVAPVPMRSEIPGSAQSDPNFFTIDPAHSFFTPN